MIVSGRSRRFSRGTGICGELYAAVWNRFRIVIVMALPAIIVELITGSISTSYGIQHFPVLLIICAIFMGAIFTLVTNSISKKIMV
jgi:hypothetical protein